MLDSFSWQWEAGALPQLASGLGLFLIFVQVLTSIKDLDLRDFKRLYSKADFLALIGFMAGVAAITIFGFFWGGLLLIFGLTFFMSGRQFGKATIASLPVLLLPLVERVLQIQLFQGVLRLPAPW